LRPAFGRKSIKSAAPQTQKTPISKFFLFPAPALLTAEHPLQKTYFFESNAQVRPIMGGLLMGWTKVANSKLEARSTKFETMFETRMFKFSELVLVI